MQKVPAVNCFHYAAFFQYGDPIYSAKCVRFRMGYPKSPLRSETLVSDEDEGQLTADDNYNWTYTSPEFPMLQVSLIDIFRYILFPHERKKFMW